MLCRRRGRDSAPELHRAPIATETAVTAARRSSPCSLCATGAGFGRAGQAVDGHEIFVQFEPDGVIAVDDGARHECRLSLSNLVERGSEAFSIMSEPRRRMRDLLDERIRTGMQQAEPCHDGSIVVVIGVL